MAGKQQAPNHGSSLEAGESSTIIGNVIQGVVSVASFFFTKGSKLPVKSLFRDVQYCPRVLLVGLDNGGKTRMLNQYLSVSKGDDITSVILAIGYWVEVMHHEAATFLNYDICSRTFSKAFDQALFREVDALVFVLDANDIERLPEARDEFETRVLKSMREGVPLLILAAKQDLPRAKSPEEIQSLFIDDMSTSIGDRPCRAIGTNLNTGQGLKDAFQWLGSTLAETDDIQTDEKSPQTLRGPGSFDRPSAKEEIIRIFPEWRDKIFKMYPDDKI